MPSYQLSKAADADLTELYTFSFAEFGEHRADAYFQSLENCLQKLADQPQLGLNVSALRKDYMRFVHRRHSIYYKRLRSGILVGRILGRGISAERNLP